MTQADLSTDKASIAVYCGAQNAVSQDYLQTGAAFGKALAEKNIRLVFGGGDCGMMGAVSNGVMAHGGEAIGVFPSHLRTHEAEHTGITQTIIVNSMHERKQMMFDLSDMFAILPGGFGTLDEMFEVLTWRQIGLHKKETFILNHNGYWNHLFGLIDNIIGEKFAKPVNREFFQVVNSLDELVEAVAKEASKKNAVSA